MDLYLEILKWSFIPMVSVVVAGILSAALLYGSRLITTNGNETFIQGSNYTFLPKDYILTFVSSGTLTLITMFIIPLLNEQTPNYHWSGILLISSMVVQSVIDSKYHELADEWNLLIAITTTLYMIQGSSLSTERVAVVFVVFALFALSTILLGSPGFGDAKYVFAAGLLIGSLSNLYSFLFVSIGVSVIVNMVVFITSIFRKENTWKEFNNVRFPFGPYLTIGFLLLMAGAI